eukprot:3677995-Lingulodinium_polyedra.AAC.1
MMHQREAEHCAVGFQMVVEATAARAYSHRSVSCSRRGWFPGSVGDGRRGCRKPGPIRSGIGAQ